MAITLARRRLARQESAEREVSANVPPVLPVVTMTVQPDATLRVAVDGEPFGAPTFAPPWHRPHAAPPTSFARMWYSNWWHYRMLPHNMHANSS